MPASSFSNTTQVMTLDYYHLRAHCLCLKIIFTRETHSRNKLFYWIFPESVKHLHILLCFTASNTISCKTQFEKIIIVVVIITAAFHKICSFWVVFWMCVVSLWVLATMSKCGFNYPSMQVNWKDILVAPLSVNYFHAFKVALLWEHFWMTAPFRCLSNFYVIMEVIFCIF